MAAERLNRIVFSVSIKEAHMPPTIVTAKIVVWHKELTVPRALTKRQFADKMDVSNVENYTEVDYRCNLDRK
jgi:hypothetical protein